MKAMLGESRWPTAMSNTNSLTIGRNSQMRSTPPTSEEPEFS